MLCESATALGIKPAAGLALGTAIGSVQDARLGPSGSASNCYAAVACPTLQALQAAHNRSLEVLAEAEARLKDEAAAKAGRDAKAQQVCAHVLVGTLGCQYYCVMC